MPDGEQIHSGDGLGRAMERHRAFDWAAVKDFLKLLKKGHPIIYYIPIVCYFEISSSNSNPVNGVYLVASMYGIL